MGNQLPPETGGICEICEGIRWPVDQGPKYVLASVAGVKKCEGQVPGAGDGNGSYLLEYYVQCGWGFTGYEYEVVWTPGHGTNRLQVYNMLGAFYWFRGWCGTPCCSNFINLNHCPLDPTEGGSGNPTPVDGPTEIFNTYYGMFPEPYYEFEKWDIGNHKYMYRVCDGTGRVNVLFIWDRKAKINI